MSSYISKKGGTAEGCRTGKYFLPSTAISSLRPAFLSVTAFIYIKRESVSVDQLDPGIKRLSDFIVCRAANKQKIVSLSYSQLCRFLRGCPTKLDHFLRTGYA